MTIPKLKKQDVIDALKFIDENGVPEHNTSVKYVLVSEDGKKYPPKYVVAVGGCTISGGPFKTSYNVVKGIEEIVPVDVYVPGCPPRPEAILYGMMQLQRKVKIEKFFGGANHKQNSEERELGLSNEAIASGWKKPMVVTDVPTEFVENIKKEQEGAK